MTNEIKEGKRQPTTILKIIHPPTNNNCAWGGKMRMGSIVKVNVPSNLTIDEQIEMALKSKKCNVCGTQYEFYRFFNQSL